MSNTIIDNGIDEPYTITHEDGTDVYRYVSDNRVFYKTTTYKAIKEVVEQPKYIVEKALVLEYNVAVLNDWADLQKPYINRIVKEFSELHSATGDIYEIVFSSKNKQFPFKCPTSIQIPADIRLITEIERHFRELHGEDFSGWTLKHNLDCISTAAEPEKSKNAIDKKDVLRPSVDVNTVPEHLRFMCTAAFKDQAKQFYEALNRIFPSSDRSWVRKYYVEKLDTWSHIARADDAIGGLIKNVMSVIAEHPHFPAWWRSFGVHLTKGNPQGAIDSCQRILNYNGDKKVFIEKESDHDSSTMSY
ncbi:hypothetical protein ABDF71_10025 [Ochrobactrum sp. WV_118_8]